MPRRSSLMSLVAVAAALVSSAPMAEAARPSDALLPDTTKGYLSVPDVDALRAKWDETQLGQLMRDPVMRPFADDLREQMEAKLNKAGLRLNIKMSDLKGVYGGEVCVAAVQPNRDKSQHAVVILVDVTGHLDEARALLAKISANLTEQGGTKSTVRMSGVEVVRIVLPKKDDQRGPDRVLYALHENQLIATDHEAVCRDILSHFAGEHQDTLAHVAAYRVSMARCRKAIGAMAPHLRWFAEPFGLTEVMRAANGGRRRRGTDMLKVLSNQGFRAIQGVGGVIVLATGEHELLHHTFVYAPRPYRLAARMLDFPNASGLNAQDWIPRNGALYLTFKWKMKDAFEYAKTLVDEIVGDVVFDEVLKSIKLDPNGPRLDIRRELIAHLSDRATFVTDNRLPITPESQRFMFAVELTDPELVRQAVDKAMESDPEAKKRQFAGHVIWEILNEEEEDQPATPMVDGVPGFGQFGFQEQEEEEEEAQGTLPNSAVTVAYDHLIIASHVDYVRDMLSQDGQSDRLADALDYILVNDELEKLGAGTDSMRIFGRTDEVYRPTYELIRQGKMPESKTILGKFLNRLLGPDEEGLLRQQQIDGSKMPDYQIVRRYLGPSGTYVRTEQNGWFITGCLLNKEAQ